jgi:hypothetical protein
MLIADMRLGAGGAGLLRPGAALVRALGVATGDAYGGNGPSMSAASSMGAGERARMMVRARLRARRNRLSDDGVRCGAASVPAACHVDAPVETISSMHECLET